VKKIERDPTVCVSIQLDPSEVGNYELYSSTVGGYSIIDIEKIPQRISIRS
jgi:hypothetical protein